MRCFSWAFRTFRTSVAKLTLNEPGGDEDQDKDDQKVFHGGGDMDSEDVSIALSGWTQGGFSPKQYIANGKKASPGRMIARLFFRFGLLFCVSGGKVLFPLFRGIAQSGRARALGA